MQTMMKILVAVSIISGAVACSAPAKAPTELVEARSAVSQAKADPLKLRFEDDAEQASIELAKAENLLQENKDLALVKHRAYLATQYAALVKAQADNVRLRQKIDSADEQRQTLLLKAQKTATERAEQEAAALSEQLAELKSENTERGLLLTLTDVLFDINQSQIKIGAMGTMDKIANYLQSSDSKSIIIEGHTDSQGNDELNMTLSQNRALNVRDALVQRGIAADRITAVGKGEKNPVASNNSAAGRQQNRRVEIVITSL